VDSVHGPWTTSGLGPRWTARGGGGRGGCGGVEGGGEGDVALS
jgi:hypothetical protein